jgi:ABC-type iron transport system FetAB permease component
MVLPYSLFMTLVAALEACQRPAYSYQGQYLHTLLAMSMGSWTMITYTALVVMQLRPLWEAQYVIPVLGMLLVRVFCTPHGDAALGHCGRFTVRYRVKDYCWIYMLLRRVNR